MFSKELMLKGIDLKIKTRQLQVDAINERMVNQTTIENLVNRKGLLEQIQTLTILKEEIENCGYDE